MSEGTQDLQQQTQDQFLQSAQDFFGQTMGRIKGQMQSDSAVLENQMQQFPEGDAQAQLQEMIDSYTQFQDIIDRAAEDTGVQDAVDEAAEQARQAVDEAVAQGQGPLDQAADQLQDQVQETAGILIDQVREAAGQAADQVQEAAGGAAGQVQDAADGAAGQVQQAADEAADQVREAIDEASQMAESLPEGYHAVGEPTTDEEGRTVLRGEGPEGDVVTVQRAPDQEGNVVDTVLDHDPTLRG